MGTDQRLPRARRSRAYVLTFLGAIGCVLAIPTVADAQSSDGPATVITDLPGLTDTERQVAIAVQRIYEALIDRSGELPPGQEAMFGKLEELAHTANDLLDSGNNSRSLQLTAGGLLEALNWVANEETAAKGGLATETAQGQFGNVAARLGQLRGGAGGLLLGRLEHDAYPAAVGLINHGGAVGGGASSDGLVSPVGAFVNGYYGIGQRDPTDRENAYDADYYGLTGGVDLRLTDRLVVGAATGVSRAEAEFDRSKSVADGGAEANVVTASLYGLYDVDRYYLNGIFTVGAVDYRLTRRIDYPSNNPSVDPSDETARASPTGRQMLMGLTGGYQWRFGATNVGGFGRLDYLRVQIDDYRETGAGPFNLRVGEQRIESLRSTLGVEANRVFDMDFGILQPGLRVEWHHEFENNSRDVDMGFVSDPTNTRFTAPTDSPDRDFFTVAASAAAVFPGGLQSFAEIATIIGLEDVSSTQITVGIRGEF
ncbi:MAG: autotransporter outer membrane beta-barrel domain-containing protein [Aquisalimonadaceae bacterium]